MQAVILAGGLGTRLRPLTLKTPKPIVPLLNKPFLYYQLSLLNKHGIREIIISLSHMGDRIEKEIASVSFPGMKLIYVYEDSPLGTAGAVKNAEKYIHDRLVTFNGDVLTDLDLTSVVKFHEARKAKATIVLTPVENPTMYGLIEIDKEKKVMRFLEKPSWDEVTTNNINAGTYILEPELIKLIPEGINYSFERGFFPNILKERIPFFGYESSAYWLDIGTTEKYLQANRDLLNNKIIPHFDIEGFNTSNSISIGKGTRVSDSAKLREPAIIGNNCRISNNSRIGSHTVIGNDCNIHEGVSIEESVIWNNITIHEGARLNNCIIADNCTIGAHSFIGNNVVLGNGSYVTDYSIVSK